MTNKQHYWRTIAGDLILKTKFNTENLTKYLQSDEKSIQAGVIETKSNLDLLSDNSYNIQ